MRCRRDCIRLALTVLVSMFAGACKESPTEHAQERTVVIVITGAVTVEPGGGVIEGARVGLGWGGSFSLPVVRKSTHTDTDGNYEIVDTLTYAEPCPFQWMQASASGYAGLRSIQDHRVSALCTSDTQTIDIPLAPAP